MSKRLAIVVVISLLVVVAGYYYNTSLNEVEFDIRKFTGTIVALENEVITLHGVFDGSDGTIPNELSIDTQFSFKVDKNTIFDKLETKFPTAEELAKTYGKSTVYRYNIEDLPRVESVGSLQDLQELFSSNTSGAIAGNIIVEVDFSSSIYKSKNPVASRVFYHILMMPKPPASGQIQ